MLAITIVHTEVSTNGQRSQWGRGGSHLWLRVGDQETMTEQVEWRGATVDGIHFNEVGVWKRKRARLVGSRYREKVIFEETVRKSVSPRDSLPGSIRAERQWDIQEVEDRGLCWWQMTQRKRESLVEPMQTVTVMCSHHFKVGLNHSDIA